MVCNCDCDCDCCSRLMRTLGSLWCRCCTELWSLTAESHTLCWDAYTTCRLILAAALLARRCTSLPMGDLPRHPKFKKGHTYLPTFGPWQEIRSIQLHHIMLQYVCMYIKGLRPLPPTPEAGICLRFNLGRRVACTVMFEAKVNGHVIAAGGTTYLCRSKQRK